METDLPLPGSPDHVVEWKNLKALKALKTKSSAAHGGGYAQHEASELAHPLKIELYLDDRVVTFCRQYFVHRQFDS